MLKIFDWLAMASLDLAQHISKCFACVAHSKEFSKMNRAYKSSINTNTHEIELQRKKLKTQSRRKKQKKTKKFQTLKYKRNRNTQSNKEIETEGDAKKVKTLFYLSLLISFEPLCFALVRPSFWISIIRRFFLLYRKLVVWFLFLEFFHIILLLADIWISLYDCYALLLPKLACSCSVLCSRFTHNRFSSHCCLWLRFQIHWRYKNNISLPFTLWPVIIIIIIWTLAIWKITAFYTNEALLLVLPPPPSQARFYMDF